MNRVASISQKILHRLHLGVHRTNAIILRLNKNDIRQQPPASVSFTTEEVIQPTEQDCLDLVAIGFNTPTKEHILQYLREGQRCYAARKDGRIISCFWSIRKSFYDHRLQRMIDLKENEVYLLGAFTLPEYRGKGVLDQLFFDAIDLFLKNEKDYGLVFVEEHNQPSLKLCRKLGFQQIGTIRLLTVFGVRFEGIHGQNILSKATRHFYVHV